MAKTILVVEDDTDILELVRWHLQEEGYAVLTATDGINGLGLAKKQTPDMVILDLMLPGMDGLEVCRALKGDSRTKAIPVVMLTAKGEEVDRVVGFELGADDYIVKPFSPRELVLRIRAILKRYEEKPDEKDVLVHRELRIDLASHRVWIEEEEVFLTLTEFNLLFEMLKNKGKVQTRDHLLDRVWGYQFEGYARTVDTHVRRLRKKLGVYADDIETVRGIGYRFKDE